MLSLILLIATGVILGYLLRRRRLAWLPRVVTVLVWLLLLLLGMEAGANPRVVGGLATLGMEAAVVAFSGIVGTCLASWLLWLVVRIKVTARQTDAEEPASMGRALCGSLIIIAFFAVGCAIGVCGLLPPKMMGNSISLWALYLLLVSVGMSVGNDPQALSRLRQFPRAMALLPVLTWAGTLSAVALAGLVLLPHRPLTDVLAAGSGFAYYSLSSVLITQYRGAEWGTVALLANIIREVFTLVCSPLLARWLGPLVPISCGGAASMDSTLPVIARSCGQQYVPLAIFHGFVVDTSVPIWVTFFCSF